jgi:hypothetical protein
VYITYAWDGAEHAHDGAEHAEPDAVLVLVLVLVPELVLLLVPVLAGALVKLWHITENPADTAHSISPIIVVPSCQNDWISRLLDNGAQGIIVSRSVTTVRVSS